MPATTPFLYVDKVTLAANGTGTASFQVDAGHEAKIKRMWFVSTGSFDIIEIRDSAGNSYSTASTDKPIPSSALNKPQTAGGGVGEFDPPLYIAPMTVLYIDLKDTSGSSNTVQVILEGERTTL